MRTTRLASVLSAAFAAGLLLATAASAQSTPPVRVRGTIATLDAGSVTVKERNGQTESITLDEPLVVGTVKPVAPGSIKSGSYIGVTARPAADGSLVALEVHVFPEDMRGAGEGNQPWDLEPGTTMTNATVSGLVEATGGQEVTLKYKDGSKAIRIPPNVPVVTFAPATRADLKVGAPVFVVARSKDGALHASRVTVGTDGVAPPM